jgi:hypothetical protein
MGDLNIDLLEKELGENEHAKNVYGRDKYENTLAEHGFESKINTVTRQEIRNNIITESCIDHVFIRTHLDCIGVTINEKISDHFVTALVIDTHFKTKNKTKYLKNSSNKTLNTSNIILNDKKIINELSKVDWSFLNSIECPIVMYDCIESMFKSIYETNVKKRGQGLESNNN